MEDYDAPIYYVDDIENGLSDTSSVHSSTSAFTENTMSTLTSSEVSGMFQRLHNLADR